MEGEKVFSSLWQLMDPVKLDGKMGWLLGEQTMTGWPRPSSRPPQAYTSNCQLADSPANTPSLAIPPTLGPFVAENGILGIHKPN